MEKYLTDKQKLKEEIEEFEFEREKEQVKQQRNAVLEKLCEILNETEIKFPDTNFTLFYKLVSP